MKTILFVDDEPWFHQSLRYALEARGYECLSVTNMTAALEVLSQKNISAVVTDVMMSAGPRFPQVDSQEAGFHFIKILKRDWPATKVVCLSVIGDQKKIRALRNQRVDYIRKGEAPLETAVDIIVKATFGFDGREE